MKRLLCIVCALLIFISMAPFASAEELDQKERELLINMGGDSKMEFNLILQRRLDECEKYAGRETDRDACNFLRLAGFTAAEVSQNPQETLQFYQECLEKFLADLDPFYDEMMKIRPASKTCTPSQWSSNDHAGDRKKAILSCVGGSTLDEFLENIGQLITLAEPYMQIESGRGMSPEYSAAYHFLYSCSFTEQELKGSAGIHDSLYFLWECLEEFNADAASVWFPSMMEHRTEVENKIYAEGRPDVLSHIKGDDFLAFVAEVNRLAEVIMDSDETSARKKLLMDLGFSQEDAEVESNYRFCSDLIADIQSAPAFYYTLRGEHSQTPSAAGSLFDRNGTQAGGPMVLCAVGGLIVGMGLMALLMKKKTKTA